MIRCPICNTHPSRSTGCNCGWMKGDGRDDEQNASKSTEWVDVALVAAFFFCLGWFLCAVIR